MMSYLHTQFNILHAILKTEYIVALMENSGHCSVFLMQVSFVKLLFWNTKIK